MFVRIDNLSLMLYLNTKIPRMFKKFGRSQLWKWQLNDGNYYKVETLLTSLKCWNFQRALLRKKNDRIRLNVTQVIYSSFSISWLSFKPLAQILSRYLADKISFLFFSKGHNSRKGHNSDKKKLCISYFSLRNPYMKFQNPSMHGS